MHTKSALQMQSISKSANYFINAQIVAVSSEKSKSTAQLQNWSYQVFINPDHLSLN